MGARFIDVDINDCKARTKTGAKPKATLYPNSTTWTDTWTKLSQAGLDPQKYFQRVLEEAERHVRENQLGIKD